MTPAEAHRRSLARTQVLLQERGVTDDDCKMLGMSPDVVAVDVIRRGLVDDMRALGAFYAATIAEMDRLLAADEERAGREALGGR